jgi:predicted PurR-regulated permease PerM
MKRSLRRQRSWAFQAPREAFVVVERKPQVVIAVCLVALLALVVCGVVYFARAYFLPIACAFVFAVILAPVCNRLERWRVPRTISAVLAILMTMGMMYAGFSIVAKPAAKWLDQAPTLIRNAERELYQLQAPLRAVRSISNEVENLTESAPGAARTVVVEGPGLTGVLLASAQVIAVQTLFVLVLIYFFLITREDFRLKLIAFQPSLRKRVRMARIHRDVERRVSGYIVTVSIINLVFGVAVGLALWQLGLPQPVMWGGVAALLNFVPYLGPAVTIGLLGLAGLAEFDTLLGAALPILAYLALSFVENSILTPLVMSRRMTLNPLAIILSVSFWTWVWGPVGGLVSLPLLIMLKTVCDHTPSLRAIGGLLGAPLERPVERGWFAPRRRPVSAAPPAPVSPRPQPEPASQPPPEAQPALVVVAPA